MILLLYILPMIILWIIAGLVVYSRVIAEALLIRTYVGVAATVLISFVPIVNWVVIVAGVGVFLTEYKGKRIHK